MKRRTPQQQKRPRRPQRPKPRVARPPPKRVSPPVTPLKLSNKRPAPAPAPPLMKPVKLQRKVGASSSNPHSVLRSTIGQSSVALRAGESHISTGTGHMGHYLRVQGREFLGSVTVGASTDDKSNRIYTARDNTVFVPNTRLTQFAGIYDRWRPRKWTYHFIPTMPTSQKGTIVMAQDPDPMAEYVSEDSNNTARLLTIEGSVMSQAWQTSSCHMPRMSDYTTLWTSDPNTSLTEGDRLDLAGRFYLAAAAPTGTAAGTILGLLELEYDVEFLVPRLQVASTSREYTFLYKCPDENTSTAPTPEFSIPRAGASEPSAAYRVFDTLISGVKKLVANEDLRAAVDVVNALRRYKSKADLLTSGDGGTWGFTSGDNIIIEATLMVNPGDGYALVSGVVASTQDVVGASYADGYPADGIITTNYDEISGTTAYFQDYEGNLWAKSWTWCVDMSGVGERFHADGRTLFGAPFDGFDHPHQFAWQITFRTAGIATYQEITDAGPLPQRRKAPPRATVHKAVVAREAKVESKEPISESKDEKKPEPVVAPLPTPSDEDIDDIEDLLQRSPIREKRCLPSAAPGGRLYKPSVLSVTAAPAKRVARVRTGVIAIDDSSSSSSAPPAK